MTRLPEGVPDLLNGVAVRIGEPTQALPFLTVDAGGHPHAAMVSAVEIVVAPADDSLHVALGSPRTRENLLRSGRAALLVVAGTTVHTLKLALRHSVAVEGLLAVVLDVTAHERDSIGVDLTGVTYVPTETLATTEQWSRTAEALAALGSS